LHLEFVQGDATGLTIPADAASLLRAGTDFLTAAFHRFGTLAPDNCVTRIVDSQAFAGGNSGHKLCLTIEYARSDPALHRDLFVKFSRDFDDVFRDRRRHELEAEVRLATLSRLPAFPVRVPFACFADFNHDTGTGLLITERVAFGRDGIEPLHRKCMDRELTDPLAYYRATFTALARLAAAHQSGRLSPQLELLFPFDPAAATREIPIPWNKPQLIERIRRYAAFAARYPQLLPANVRTPEFIARLERDAVRFAQHEAAIQRFLNNDPRFIALCHWNTNIDNAWFWRDAHDELQCGLLDWGMVRQMNVTIALWGGLCGADLELWDQHCDDLLSLFSDQLHAHGGPRLTVEELTLHLHLSVAMLGVAMMMDVPALIVARVPEAHGAQGPSDPILLQDPVAHGFLHVFTNFLNLWERRDFGASLDGWLANR
jgi:hypothetical protein